MKPPLELVRLGRRPYLEAYACQRERVRRRQQGAVPDALLLVEHPPVITLGRGGGHENILVAREALTQMDVEVAEIERGGNVTFHGPGQLVGYPILKLEGDEQDLHELLWRYEEALIGALARFGVEASHRPGLTGVWAGEQKIASIGVSVSKWVTFHGFALNVSTDLRWFDLINPCGLRSNLMTSLERLTGRTHDLDEVGDTVAQSFARLFGRRLLLPTTDPSPSP